MAVPIKTGAIIKLPEYGTYHRCDAYRIGDAYVFRCSEEHQPDVQGNLNASVVIGQGGMDLHDKGSGIRTIICTHHTVVVYNWGS